LGYARRMARRNPRPRGGALGLGAVAVAAALAGGAATIGAPAGHAEPAPDLARARDLYQSAEAAIQDGRYDDAARDYAAAYELSSDPALLYKIARAHERAGKCEIALIYYARYLREGQPSEPFAALTRDRIAACGGEPGSGEPAPAAGSASAGSAAGSAAPAAGSAAPSAGTAAEPPATRDAGSPATPRPVAVPPTREKIAWLLGGGAIALVALGGVLSYATSSSENDVRDLYAGFAGQPPAFDAQTRKRYDDLVDQGRRYQHLAWAAFGLAGAAAVGVTLLFTVGRDAEPAPRIAPVVGPRSAGVSVRF